MKTRTRVGTCLRFWYRIEIGMGAGRWSGSISSKTLACSRCRIPMSGTWMIPRPAMQAASYVSVLLTVNVEGMDTYLDCWPSNHSQPAAFAPRAGSYSIKWRSEERRVGKSVSVRVDLGGRRIIKKKKINIKSAQGKQSIIK